MQRLRLATCAAWLCLTPVVLVLAFGGVAAAGGRAVVEEPDGAEILEPPPLSPRSGSAVVWTGHELFVWGGEQAGPGGGAATDGAAYDPWQRTWRSIAPSPLPASPDPPVAAMSPVGVVVVNGGQSLGSAAARWDPATDRWHRVHDVPRWCREESDGVRRCWRTGPVRDLAMVGRFVVSYSANASLDLRTGRWTELPPQPRRFERFAAVSTGSKLVVVGGDSSSARNTGTLAYDPKQRTWRTLPAPALTQQAIAADWDGTRVVAVDYDGGAATYNPLTGTWNPLPTIPARFSEHFPTVAATPGGSFLALMSQAIVVNHDAKWTPLPYDDVPPNATVVAAPDVFTFEGAGVVFALGTDRRDPAAARLTLTALELGRMSARPTLLQVGAVAVTTPDGYALVASAQEGANGGRSNVTRVQLGDASGNACSISSVDGVDVDTDGTEPVTVAPTTDRGITDWHRSPDGTSWRADATTSDVVTIDCTNPSTADALARSAERL